jgi:hypothetical protein
VSGFSKFQVIEVKKIKIACRMTPNKKALEVFGLEVHLAKEH